MRATPSLDIPAQNGSTTRRAVPDAAPSAADPPAPTPVGAARDAPRHLSLGALIADVCAKALTSGDAASPRVVPRFDGPGRLDLQVHFSGAPPAAANTVLADAVQVLLGRRVISCAAVPAARERAVTYTLCLEPPAEAA